MNDFGQHLPLDDARPQLSPTAGADVFQRYEDKFVVERGRLDEFLSTIKTRMSPSYLNSNTRFTFIESLYFDSPTLISFRSHFMNLQSRFKVRTRRYAPNGLNYDIDSQLELKEKINGVSKKVRLQITPVDMRKLYAGNEVACGTRLARKNINLVREKMKDRIATINGYVASYELRPQLAVSYKRLAYSADDLRITIDDEIQYSPLLRSPTHDVIQMIHNNPLIITPAQQMTNILKSENKVIAEVKHLGVVPDWVKLAFTNVQAQQIKFSKYCAGVFLNINKK